MYSVPATWALPQVGFPIRKSPVRSLLSGFPELIAASHVLHRLLAPRHPPYALYSLTTFFPSGRHLVLDVSNALIYSLHQGYVGGKVRTPPTHPNGNYSYLCSVVIEQCREKHGVVSKRRLQSRPGLHVFPRGLSTARDPR